jgi:chromosomal replication initiator protein
VTPDAADTWSRVQDELRRMVDPGAYELWLAPLELRELTGTSLVLSAPDERRRWVADRFGRVLKACAAAVLGPGVDVDVVAASAEAVAADGAAPGLDPHGRPDLNPKLRFDQFVIGDANRLAHAAALAVAELPGTAYNPLFLYGPPGVGKTHLLQAIANYIVSYSPGMRVRYTTAERFTNEFVAATRGRADIEQFKGAYRSNDVLLIDDVQFLMSKTKTEEEFFHTFNALYDAGAQIVLTADRVPRDLQSLEDRLRARFESGLVTDIARPDRVTRTAVLRKRAQQDGIELADPAILHVIAERIGGSVRELEGGLIRVVAFASLTGRPLSATLVEEVLDGLYPRAVARAGMPPARPTVSRIQDAVCEHFSLTRDDLLSAGRAARIALPRQVAMYLCREHTEASLPSIGAAFGGRSHTTVLHAVKAIEQRLASDSATHDAVRALTARLGADRHD